MQVHVLILTALKLEHDAMDKELAKLSRGQAEAWRNSSTRSYKLYSIPSGDSYIRVALAAKTGMGQVDAAIATKDALQDLLPAVVMLVGIAGCVASPNDVHLGDVAIAAGVHDYEMGKEQLGSQTPRWRRYDCKVQLISQIETIVDSKTWSKVLVPNRPDQKSIPSTYHVGDVLSGNLVMADAVKTKERVQQATNKVIAVEMEAAAVLAAIRTSQPEPAFLMLKAFSDWAGDDKADGSSNKDSWQLYAASSAACLAAEVIKEVLSSEYFDKLNLPRAEDHLLAELRAAVKCYLHSLVGVPKFAVDIGDTAAKELAREVQSLSSLSNRRIDVFNSMEAYEVSLSRGKRFLSRAYSPFHASNSIWAISIDEVSTFWKDPHSSSSLRHYLSGQQIEGRKSKIKRLFVFSRPESAHQRAQLLDWHSAEMEGTYVTSLENYQEMLSKVLRKESVVFQRSAERDFAMLDVEVDGHFRKFVAELTDEKFRIQGMEMLIDGLSGDRNDYLDLFSILESETNGMVDGAVSPDFGIVRWKPKLWQDHLNWVNILKTIFEGRTADAYHIAGFFSNNDTDSKNLREVLSKLRYGGLNPQKGSSYNAQMGIEHVRVVDRLKYDGNSPSDGLSGQPLQYVNDGIPNTFVLMKLKDQFCLRRFMQDDWHSKLRHELLFQIACDRDDLKPLLHEKKISTTEELTRVMANDRSFAIRLLASAQIWRVDLLDNELVDKMVLSMPDRFVVD